MQQMEFLVVRAVPVDQVFQQAVLEQLTKDTRLGIVQVLQAKVLPVVVALARLQ
tara:strand:+ start:191 stop:352 length:162 start_codon:yes stop_codon:yes gene_type:complete